MPGARNFIPQGVIPAVLLPFNEDLSIDEASFRSHLRDVAAVEGLSAITVNAHSTEVASCTLDEQKRVLAIAREEAGARLPIVSGVYAEGSLEAARIARMKEALVMLGKLPKAVVRPPLVRISDAERGAIRQALVAAGLLDRSGARKAA